MKLDNRIWYLLTALVCIALVAGGVLLGVQPQLGVIATAASDKSTIDSQLTDLRTKISDLKAASADKSGLESQAAEIRKKLPAGVDGAAFIAQLNSISAATGAAVQSLDVSPAVAYAPPAATAPAADPAAEGESASPSASPSETASAAAEAAAPVATDGPLTNGAVTASNFVVIKLSISLTGNRDQVLEFIRQLQDGDRLILITGVTLTQEEGGGTSATLDGNIYALSDTAASVVASDAAAATPTNG
ncbi:hypothetical protein [Schumannella sp. 10F1B-5-1]|uniref:hypothetical protein n=1 Tax=Schumannella sp. 10F1B-5-1 TaxID=2590780 RepID=UPI0011323174|nr:hypothetical protein [Schumannella sp. 10F1B-5-1]TPW71721.1 hypothetical protein FJ658_10290 [Schumannella sp. 10F1B-5-1]